MSLCIALVIMCLSSGANTTIALCLGKLVDAVNPEVNPSLARDSLTKVAAVYLAVIGASYLVREAMNVLRRFLVEDTCTRIDKEVYVRVISHLMKVDLAVLAQDQVGALYGRITRGVDGLVRFMRIGFLDSVPALLTGTFALAAALSKQPRIALGNGRRDPSVARSDGLAAHHTEGCTPRPAAQPRAHGRHGHRATRRHGLHTGRPHAPARDSSASKGSPSGGAPRSSDITSRCRYLAPERRSMKGSSIWWSSASAIYLLVHGGLKRR